MYEHEYDWKGNRGLIVWLRDLAPTFGIKVGGKTVRELMDEIQCVSLSSKVRSVAKTSTNPSSTVNISTPASVTASSAVSPHMLPIESSLGHSMTPFPPKGTKG